MTRVDRYGEPLETDDVSADVEPSSPPRTRDEIRQHCAELRQILADSRARREVDQ